LSDKTPSQIAAEIDDLKRSLSACARAVSHDESLAVTFERGQGVTNIGGTKLSEPESTLEGDALSATRGQADAVALWRAHRCSYS